MSCLDQLDQLENLYTIDDNLLSQYCMEEKWERYAIVVTLAPKNVARAFVIKEEDGYLDIVKKIIKKFNLGSAKVIFKVETEGGVQWSGRRMTWLAGWSFW